MVGPGRTVATAQRAAPVPIEDQDSGVVAEVTRGRAEYCGAKFMDDFAGMQIAGLSEGPGDVEPRSVAFQHAVGDEDEPIAGLQWELLHPERAARLQAERQVDVEVNLLDAAVAQPQREWVPGIDDGRRTAVQVDAQKLAGDEVARLGVRGQIVVGVGSTSYTCEAGQEVIDPALRPGRGDGWCGRWRRTQPRTVPAGRPSRAAIRRCPQPAAASTTPAPITTASSARRSRALTGNNT